VDLLYPVGSGQGCQDRLVESGQEQLHLAAGHKPTQLIEIGAVMRFQPLEQRSREVQHERKEAPLGQTLQDGPVNILNVLLEDMIEVSDWLVQVQPKYEAYGGHVLSDHE
jgi:hypothetical protein